MASILTMAKRLWRVRSYCPYRRKPGNCVLWLIVSTVVAPDPTMCLPCWFGCPCERRPQVEETVHQTNKPIDLVAQSLCLLHRCHKRPPHSVAHSLCLPVSSSRRLQSLCLLEMLAKHPQHIVAQSLNLPWRIRRITRLRLVTAFEQGDVDFHGLVSL